MMYERIQHRKITLFPWKPAAVHDNATDAVAVPSHEFRQAVHDDIRAEIDRPAEIRSGERVVDHQRDLMLVGYFRHRFHVEHVASGIANGLSEQQLRSRRNRFAKVLRVIGLDECYIEPKPSKTHIELGVRSAI
jgi:hypothetical protein